MTEDVSVLMRRLKQKIGQKIRFEYVQLTKKEKLVVRLTIDGEEYIDAARARRDHIRHAEEGRNLWTIVCAIALVGWLIAFIRAFRRKNVSHAQRSLPPQSAVDWTLLGRTQPASLFP